MSEQPNENPTSRDEELAQNAANQGADTIQHDENTHTAELRAANEALEQEDVAITPEYKPEGEAEQLPEPTTPLEASVIAAMDYADEAEHNPAIEAVDHAVENVIAQTNQLSHDPEAFETPHHYSDVVELPYVGTIEVMGGIYTVVFGALAVLTIFEVLVAEILPSGWFTTSVLVVASLAKAVLVVMFYMHLNTDNPLFRVVLLLPLIIVVISILYLLGVPTGEGLGYS